MFVTEWTLLISQRQGSDMASRDEIGHPLRVVGPIFWNSILEPPPVHHGERRQYSSRKGAALGVLR